MKMAASEVSSNQSQRRFRGISAALASAFLEWLLICMLLINAIFSYLIVKFAYHCKLKMPCVLCSRLDHILGSKKLKRYWRMIICTKHKSEISSLVYCGAHEKLVDVHRSCENCLFSFTSANKSNSEKFRWLAGKLREVSLSDQNSLVVCHSSIRKCSCCNEFWIPRRYDRTLMPSKSIDFDAADKEKQAITSEFTEVKTRDLNHLSHDGYKALKIDSDTESLLDHDNHVSAETKTNKECAVECIPVEPRIIELPETFDSDKQIDPASAQEPLLSVSEMHCEENHPVAHGLGLEEMNWHFYNDNHPPYPETKETLVEVVKEGKSLSIDGRDVPVEESKEIDLISADVRKTIGDELADHKLVDVLAESNEAETPAQDPIEIGTTITEKDLHASVIETNETTKEEGQTTSTAEVVLVTNPVVGENVQKEQNLLDLSDAYKLAVSNRGRQLSGVGKDSSRISEDLKLLLSQLSAAREQVVMIDINPRVPISPRISMSPRYSINSEESKNLDSLNNVGMQILQRRMSLERNLSGQSLDGSTVSEIEGESMVDRLKRQVEHDKKLLSTMYKELEEERSASAIAANQAMAMITKLQEEKALLHMEALQCLRMMEEQAEYDMEALQKTTDLLAEKEKVIQDLEGELEYYRTNFQGEPPSGNALKAISDTTT